MSDGFHCFNAEGAETQRFAEDDEFLGGWEKGRGTLCDTPRLCGLCV